MTLVERLGRRMAGYDYDPEFAYDAEDRQLDNEVYDALAEIIRLGTDWADAEARLATIRQALEPLREIRAATPDTYKQFGELELRQVAALRNLLPALLDAAGEE